LDIFVNFVLNFFRTFRDIFELFFELFVKFFLLHFFFEFFLVLFWCFCELYSKFIRIVFWTFYLLLYWFFYLYFSIFTKFRTFYKSTFLNFSDFFVFFVPRFSLNIFHLILSQFMSLPFPSPRCPRIHAHLSVHHQIFLSLPRYRPLPPSGASFSTLLWHLGTERVLSLFHAVLSQLELENFWKKKSKLVQFLMILKSHIQNFKIAWKSFLEERNVDAVFRRVGTLVRNFAPKLFVQTKFQRRRF